MLYFAWVRERIGLPRERIELLVDPDSHFLELCALAGHEVALQSALRLCARTLKVDRVGFWRFADDRQSLALARDASGGFSFHVEGR